MSNLDFDGLMKLSDKERSKLTKNELVEAIGRYSFYYKNNIEEVKQAKDALVTQSKNEDAAKAILVGYLGLPATEKSSYGDDIKVDYTLLDLVGKVLANKS